MKYEGFLVSMMASRSVIPGPTNFEWAAETEGATVTVYGEPYTATDDQIGNTPTEQND